MNRYRLIQSLLPHVLVKGGDRLTEIVGREEVEAAGGITSSVRGGQSTSGIIEDLEAVSTLICPHRRCEGMPHRFCVTAMATRN